MPKIITLPKNAQFFVAICKSHEHTWITLGAIDPETELKFILAYFGKRLTFTRDYYCAGRVKTIFGTVPGVLTRDFKFKYASKKGIALAFEYKAFEINYEDYINSAKNISALVKDKYQDYDEITKSYHKNKLYFPLNSIKPYEFT